MKTRRISKTDKDRKVPPVSQEKETVPQQSPLGLVEHAGTLMVKGWILYEDEGND